MARIPSTLLSAFSELYYAWWYSVNTNDNNVPHSIYLCALTSQYNNNNNSHNKQTKRLLCYFRASRFVLDSVLWRHFSFSYTSSLNECQFIPETQNAKATFLPFQCSHRLREPPLITYSKLEN